MLLRMFAMVCALTLVVAGARAAQVDPAAARIESFDSALLEAMKGGKALGVKGRYSKLAPVIRSTFDLPTMTRFAVGPYWSQTAPADQRALIDAFTRLSIASYAHNFDDYSGERFEADPQVQTRGPDKIVQTRLVKAGDAPVSLIYRMRQADGGWKIIDVYYGAISQLTTRRSDFAKPLAAGGAKGLIDHVNALADGLMK